MVLQFDKTENFFKQTEVQRILEEILKSPRADFLTLELGFNSVKTGEFEPLSQSFFEKIRTLLQAKPTDNDISSPLPYTEEICSVNLKGNDGSKRMKVKFASNFTSNRKILKTWKSMFLFGDVFFFKELDERNKENFFRIVLICKQITNYILHCSMLFVFDLYNFRGINITCVH